MIDRLALPLLLAGCVLLAAIVVAEIESSPAPSKIAMAVPRAPDTPSAPIRREAAGRYDALLATTLARPLFSTTRRPPSRVGAGDADDSGLADSRLTGIVTEPGRRIAIFAPAGAKALTVSEGETVGGWRIERITPQQVSLSGPDGLRTLQPKFDPNLVPAPAPSDAVNRPAAPPAPPFSAAVRPGLPPIFNRAPPRPGQLRGRR
ncbi:MAG: hypothetical protein ACREE9_01605 [Stellaceae bacterium]